MKVLNAFPSKYLKAADLDAPKLLTMEKVTEEPMPDGETKPVLYFREEKKGLVLNKTNTRTIAALLKTDESEQWVGHKIVVYSAMVQSLHGEMVEGIRVRPPKKPVAPPAPAPQTHDELEPPLDDEIPY